MIEVRGLSHRPISSGFRPKLFERLNLTLSPGEIVLLAGRNGAGKTTLARYLAGLLIPTEGSITVDGFDTRDLTHLREVRRRVGLLFQESHSQIVAQTLLEEVAFGLENLAFPSPEIYRRSVAALERVGLGGYSLEQTVESLTPAERQCLTIAGLLALRPCYFVFDEPDTAADPRILKQLALLMQELRAEGHGILLISHRDFTDGFYNRALLLEEGQLNVMSKRDKSNKIAWDGNEAIQAHSHAPSNFTLEAQNLSFGYEGSSKMIIQDLSLSVHAGEFIVLQGTAGSGKSTLMQLLAGLEEPSRGKVLVKGRPIMAMHAAERVRAVALVFQEPCQQLLGESVAAEIQMGLEAQQLDQEDQEHRARSACESVGLDWEQLRERPAHMLSGGEQARLAIAAILVLDPHLLIIDETLTALDPEGQLQIISAFHELRHQGKTIILVSSSEFREHASRIWVLENGSLVYDGPGA